MNPLKQIREHLNRKRALHRGLQIGSDCEINNGWDFGSEPYLVTLGNHVRVCAGVRFITHDGGVWVLRTLYSGLEDVDIFKRITIGNNCHIGTDVTIMPGVQIGSNCIVGCNSVVTHSLPDNSVAVGVPARVICTIDDYVEKHREEFMHTKQLSWTDKRAVAERVDI